MKSDKFYKLKLEEAEFFDDLAELRSSNDDVIAIEADLRRATKRIPKKNKKLFLIDPKMSKLLNGKETQNYIKILSSKIGARILDFGCGSGWLSLELARNGCHVEAYDISPKAIKLAKKMLKQNPYKNNFGSIKYNLKDITKVELGIEKYDAVTGWSSFHHIPNVKAFIQKVYKALKKDGLIATMDDMPQSRLERSISYLFEFILPTYNLSYIEKVKKIINIMFKKENLRKEIFSPMEKAKHTSVYEIHEIIKKKFHIIHYNEKMPFWDTCYENFRSRYN